MKEESKEAEETIQCQCFKTIKLKDAHQDGDGLWTCGGKCEKQAESFLRGKGLTGDFSTKRMTPTVEKGELLTDWFNEYAKTKTEPLEKENKKSISLFNELNDLYHKNLEDTTELRKDLEKAKEEIQDLKKQLEHDRDWETNVCWRRHND